jgi:hypothetical protein
MSGFNFSSPSPVSSFFLSFSSSFHLLFFFFFVVLWLLGGSIRPPDKSMNADD